MIRFKTIKWKNLLSTGNAFTEISLTETPTTLILGKNGSGKSTLLDALCFALFNKPYRNVNKPQLLNSVNGKNCVVEVEFSVGKKEYKVIRGIKPTIFEIYIDGGLVNQDAASRDYQKFLEESVLKLNYKSFTQIVILGSASFTPFMQLTPAVRREIIEDILDIQVFTIMNGILKTRIKEVIDMHLQLGRDIELAKQKTLVQEKYIKNLQEDTARWILEAIDKGVECGKKIIALEAQLPLVEKEVERLEDSKNEYSGWEIKWIKQDKLKFGYEKELQRLQSDLELFKKNNVCLVCGQEIGIGFKKAQIKAKQDIITLTENDLGEVVSRMKVLKGHMNRLDKLVEQYDEKKKELDKLNNDLFLTKQFMRSHNERVIELQKKNKGNVGDEKKKLQEFAKEVISLSKKKTELLEDKYYLELVGTLLKDSGIKTSIINQYLPVINKLVNKYLGEMDFYVQFTLNDEFKEIIRSRFRDEFTYASFSEGEKQRIDLSLLFTWRTIAKMKNSASTNLLILDEVFDSSLDIAATEALMMLIQLLSKESHVFVISHKPDELTDKFNRILRFEKPQNFSILMEDK